MNLKEFKRNTLRFLGMHLLYYVISILMKTVRIKKVNADKIEKLRRENQNFVLAFWHNSMLIPWYLHRDKNFAAIVSQSKDGEILTRILLNWKYEMIRGSSHIGGKEAMQLLTNKLDENFNIAITPDGPTGPPKKMKAGAVVAAKKTGKPLFLTGIAMKNKIVFKSWDKFEIPKPFTKIVALYSEPIVIDNSISREETEKIILNCEKQLQQLETDAERICLS